MTILERVSRRDWLKCSAVGLAGTSVSGWFSVLAERAEAARSQGVKHKSCILLWMAGGPSQGHTFDLKNGTDFKPISTSVPGIQISEHLPKLAQQAKELVLLRGMSTGDGNHQTASYLMHTGFRKGQGGVVYPSMGSIVAADLGRPEAELPNFVAVGGAHGAGYLGPKFAPLIVNGFDKGLPDLTPSDPSAVDDRMSLVEELDEAFLTDYQAGSTKAHLTYLQRAISLMKSSATKAFDLNQEPTKSREAYGSSRFGQGCLLARRLVEVGVPFVEVTLGGWDTHNNTPQRIQQLSAQLDAPYATLLADLKERGLLDTTLVIWMGEFGRDPKRGSSHYARAWTSVLAGGGLTGGRVVGRTGKSGADVEETKINAADFMATICHILGIDYTKSYTARGGRPMPKVAKGAKHVAEVLG